MIRYKKVKGIQLDLSNSCIQGNNRINENILVHYFNLYFSIYEFQIIFLLSYLEEMKFQVELLNQNIEKNDINNNQIMNKYNQEIQIKFIKKMESEGIISKDEFNLENNINVNKIKIQNKLTEEKDFYENPNKFFFEAKINEIKFVIYKIYPDLTKANFIQLKLSKIELTKINNYFDDS